MELLHLNELKNKKNLLAFSGGVDSSMLFFYLYKQNINFDIIIINYNFREESKEEVNFALELSKFFNKKIYLYNNTKTFKTNIELEARNIRYKFFYETYKKFNYDNLITAHQFNDRVEWFLMQLSKGSGTKELMSLNSKLNYLDMNIIRPLFNVSRNEIQKYLNDNTLPYYIDKSNFDKKYKRNYYRNVFVNDFVKNNFNGLKKSFNYINKDINTYLPKEKKIVKNELKFNFFKINNDKIELNRFIRKNIKELFNYVLSNKQMKELEQNNYFLINNDFIIESNDKYIFIFPYKKRNIILSKKQKEYFRKKKIPKYTKLFFIEEFYDFYKF